MHSRWRGDLRLRLRATSNLGERLAGDLSDPRAAYVVNGPQKSPFTLQAPFEAVVAEEGRGMRVEKVFTDRSGKKILVLTKVDEQK